MKTTLKYTAVGIAIFLAAFFIGRVSAPSGDATNNIEVHEEHQHEAQTEVWTCSMHPNVRQNEPGDCPICGMDLIPVSEMGDDPQIMEMTAEAVSLADIQTTEVINLKPEKEVYLQGKVKVDERNISVISSRYAGRIEKLYVDFTGMTVNKGQRLASIYSPELITAQQELFEAVKYKASNPALYQAAKGKLKLWNLSDAQIEAIEKEGKPQTWVDVLAPISGVVMKREVTVGDYVKEGTTLFEVVDLSRVWIIFDAYESDLAWIKENDKVKFSISSLPGEKFEGKVDFIDPFINPATRTAAIRVEVMNRGGKLKPEMFANGTIDAKLPLKEAKPVVSKSAVLWTGKRSIVYVLVKGADKPAFQYRVVTLGTDLGTHYVVEEGLMPGEKVVSNGAFKVDAAAQLAGKYSMMNGKKQTVAPKTHNH